jgi:hypothetical protein
MKWFIDKSSALSAYLVGPLDNVEFSDILMMFYIKQYQYIGFRRTGDPANYLLVAGCC